jgi:hypothetical protein
VELEQVQSAVDGIDEGDLAGQGVDGADAARADGAAAVGDLLLEVARGEHGLAAPLHVGLVQTALYALLAVGQLAAYARFHLKSLRW